MQCIFIKKPEQSNEYADRLNRFKLDSYCAFSLYGSNVVISDPQGNYGVSVSIECFQEHFSYLQDSQGRIML